MRAVYIFRLRMEEMFQTQNIHVDAGEEWYSNLNVIYSNYVVRNGCAIVLTSLAIE
jgi:hypothetical protein